MTNFDRHTEDTKQDFWEFLNLTYEDNVDVLEFGFYKEGTHNIRIIPKDNELIVVEKEYHTYDVDGEVKNVVCLGKECPICKVANEVNDLFLKPIRLDKSFLYLIDTDSPNENWTPGNYYILLSHVLYSKKDRFEKALISYVNKTLKTDINGKILLDNLLDYTKEIQGSLQVKFKSGGLEFVSVSFDPLTKSPKLDEKIIKDLNYYIDYINDHFEELDFEELEEDAKKLRLEYNYNSQEQQ